MMTARLEYSPLFERKVRVESWEAQGVSSLAEARVAIRDGAAGDAAEMVDNYLAEMRFLYDGYLAWICDWIQQIGAREGVAIWDYLERALAHLANLNITTLPTEITESAAGPEPHGIEVAGESHLRQRASGALLPISAWLQVGRAAEAKLRSVISAGEWAASLHCLETVHREHKPVHDVYSDWLWLTLLAERWGEKAMHALMMDSGTRLRTAGLKALPKIPVADQVRMMAAAMRGRRSGPGEEGDIHVREDAEKYVIEFDACGSGGRMRRHGEIDRLPPRQDAPFRLGMAREAGPMSWGLASVPYYCTHCAAYAEIMSTDLIGYPSRVTLFNPDGSKPCAWALYKNPESIPEQYLLE
jgi:hypothetical protein